MKKIVIITGASKGIGYATASFFQQNNWRVINISRSPCFLKNITNIRADLSDPDIAETLVKELTLILGEKCRICLIHNAASHLNDTIMTQDPGKLSEALQVSITSPAIINKIVIPFMTKNSSIIYLGSTLSEKAISGAASYIIAKHAVVGMMRATCQDLALENIHTACICPGFTNTEMLQQHLSHDPLLLEFAKGKVGAKRLIEPDEIAELIYFSACNPIINGSVIHANLGQLET